MMFILVKVKLLDVHGKTVLCSHQPFNSTSRHSLIFRIFICILYFVLFNFLHICGLHSLIWEFVEVLNYWFVPPQWIHKHSAHVLVNLIGQRSSLKNNTWHILVHLALILVKGNLFTPHSPLQTTHHPCFRTLQINLILTSKLVHEKSTTNIEWNALKTTLSYAWEIKVWFQ
jgi:hypothetical protein